MTLRIPRGMTTHPPPPAGSTVRDYERVLDRYGPGHATDMPPPAFTLAQIRAAGYTTVPGSVRGTGTIRLTRPRPGGGRYMIQPYSGTDPRHGAVLWRSGGADRSEPSPIPEPPPPSQPVVDDKGPALDASAFGPKPGGCTDCGGADPTPGTTPTRKLTSAEADAVIAGARSSGTGTAASSSAGNVTRSRAGVGALLALAAVVALLSSSGK